MTDRFWELVSKKALGEASNGELQELDRMLRGNPKWKGVLEMLTTLAHQSLPVERDEEAEKAFEQHLKRIKDTDHEFNDDDLPGDLSRRSRSRRGRWAFLAGAIIVATLFFFFFRDFFAHPKGMAKHTISPVEASTKPGSRYHLKLPDGSSVSLNASSNLTYDKSFGSTFREVNLTGEAYFDVVKDPSRPFIIHTKAVDIKVLGTEFNVKAYPNDKYTETSLIRGTVEVSVRGNPDVKYFLKAKEKVIVPDNILDQPVQASVKPKPAFLVQPLTYVPADSTVVETSWVLNKLIFQDNETFRDVALKMERWYGVDISFADDEVAQVRPFGSFTSETISQALDALRETYRFHYKMSGNNIIISK